MSFFIKAAAAFNIDILFSSSDFWTKLKEHYGSSIFISEINGKSNVVTFRQNASTILHNFCKESTAQKSEEENKMSILKAAAAFMKNDIR
jgi:hypothetical protein